MADAQRIIELVFNGVDKTGAATKSALENASKLSRSIEDATAPIANFTAGAAKLEAGLLAAGAAMTAFAIHKAADFQDAAYDLKKVLTDADPALEQFTDRALELSTAFAVSATDVLQSMANFKQAGFTAEEASLLTKNALELFIAGDVEAARGADLLVASLKGFGAEASDAAVIIDLLNAVSNEYATNLEELIIGFSELSPVAKAAGLSFEQTAGILTPGIEVFRSGSEVATAMRTSLLRLQSDSKPVQEALAALGVAQHDTNGQLRMAGDIYFDVARAFGGLNDAQKTYYAAQLVGMNQSSKFLAVIEGLDKTLYISSDAFNYLGSAAEEVAVRLGSAKFAADQAMKAFDNMFIVIGAPLLDEFGGMAGALTSIFAAIGKSVKEGQLGGLVGYVEGVMQDIQSTMETVARNLPAALEKADLSGFTRGIDVVREAFELLFDNIDLSTVDGLTRAIELAGTAFLGLSQFTAGVVESFKPLFDWLSRVASGLESLDVETIKSAGNIFGFVTQVNALAGGLNDLMPMLEGLLAILLVRQGVGLVGALTQGAGGAKGLAAALLGPGSVQAAALAAAGALGYLAGEFLVTNTAIGDSSRALGRWIADLVWADEIAAAAVPSIESLYVPVEKLTRAATDSSVALDGLLVPLDKLTRDSSSIGLITREYERMMEAGRALALVTSTYTGSLQEQEDQAAGLVPIFDELSGAIIRYTTLTKEGAAVAEGSYKGIVPILDEATGAVIGYEHGWVEMGSTLDAFNNRIDSTGSFIDKIKDKTKEAKTEQEKWNQEVLKMQHAEKLEIIQAQAQITTAEIEASARRTVAAYESLGVTVQSTGQVITDLYGVLASGDLDISRRFDLERLISAENERRGEALALQNELTEAQIKEANARADSLARGDGIITINGDGLAPHLEAFMWEILRAIQVRVNAEGYEMLLGT